MPNTPLAVVTGGGGFLGTALCKKLFSTGWKVRALGRSQYPALQALGIETIQGDVSGDLAKLISVCSGAAVVFHTAAKVSLWGPYQEFEMVNVVGTRNVIEACRRAGVSRLVFTSSPSVIAAGTDLCGVDESVPYPMHYHANYPKTKAMAERLVLEANGEGLKTLALRPHLIFGPGDTNLEPLVVARAKAGRLFRIGDGKNLADFSYIDDCVQAHLCAADALEKNPRAAGRPYFISQGVPVPLWDWINAALTRNGLPPVSRAIPKFVAEKLGSFFEGLARVLPINPPFTKFLAEEMSTSHYFNISAAKKELGYEPQKKDCLSW